MTSMEVLRWARGDLSMAAGEIRGSLPMDITAFVGRDELVAKACRLLDHVRLLTLTGTGGVGKTRLALRVLQQMAADRAWIIDVGSLGSHADRAGDDLYAHVARQLEIRHNGNPGLATLIDHLRGQAVVLVLDNCEHLVAQTRQLLRELLVAAPHVRIVATSRQVLGVEGEHNLRVPPLALVDAVELFIEHATLAGADRASLQSDPDVERLCRRLDGLPLAIRLAAGRLPALSVRDLLALLDDRFQVLKDIEPVVAWSYELCSAEERRVWVIASAFTGDVDLAAITSVAAAAGVDQAHVVHLVDGLVKKSVLTADSPPPGEPARYEMLNTLREYGLRRLDESGDARRLRGLHRDYYRRLVADAAATWLGPAELDVMAAVHRQLADILAAVEGCVVDGDLATARAICRDLVRCRAPFFWGFLGLVAQLLRRVIDASRHAIDSDLVAVDVAATAALAGWIAVTVGRSDDAEMLITTAKTLLEQRGMATIPPVLFADGGRQALGLGMREGIGLLRATRELLSGVEHVGDRHMATMVWAMGFALAGEPQAAADASRQYLREAEQAQAPWAISWALWTAALAALSIGDHERATDCISRCLRLQRDMDDQWGQTWAIELCAWNIAAELDSDSRPHDARRAARLLGAAQARQDKLGVHMAGLQGFAARRAAAQSQIVSVLEEEGSAAAYASGRRDHEYAIPIALGEPVPRGPRSATPDGLSSREREIADLVARGLSSSEIGAELGITESTVKTHVKRILAALSLPNRAALASWVGRARPTG
jgi:predicted ATPase/DNA-binding NarL/FixJ family response regulator